MFVHKVHYEKDSYCIIKRHLWKSFLGASHELEMIPELLWHHSGVIYQSKAIKCRNVRR